MKRLSHYACQWLLLVCGLTASISASATGRDEVVFYFNDALGSAVAAVSESGNLCWSEVYSGYGEKTIDSDHGLNGEGCGVLGEERGYTGHTQDWETDLVYMQQRYYDASIGRFLSIDPLDADPNNPMTFNRYAYGNNNPYKYIDPDGRYATDYNADNVGDFITSEATRMLEHGEARAVLASEFTLEDSMEHFQSGSGIPIVVTGSLDVYERIGKGPYGEGCGSADGTCQREVGTRGSTFFVHGRLTGNLGPANDVISLEPESYGFESDPNASLARNTNTAIGSRLHGQGTVYMIHYSHRARLRSFFGFRR